VAAVVKTGIVDYIDPLRNPGRIFVAATFSKAHIHKQARVQTSRITNRNKIQHRCVTDEPFCFVNLLPFA